MSSLGGRPKGSINKRPQHKWSDKEKDYLREITPGRHHKEIVELMNERFEYEFNIQQVKGAITRYGLNTGFTGRFEKGKIPFNKGTKGLMKPNKTSFKKGDIPKNYRSIGSERITKDGYIEVKVADPNKWELKQRLVWESHNGKIKKGNAILFADGNKLNTNIDNLRLVSRRQLL
ncbi:MAG: HNH endonuclease signature motif containing protein, partial [Cetobacterium sp.]